MILATMTFSALISLYDTKNGLLDSCFDQAKGRLSPECKRVYVDSLYIEGEIQKRIEGSMYYFNELRLGTEKEIIKKFGRDDLKESCRVTNNFFKACK